MTEAAQVNVSAPKPDRRLKVRGSEHTMRRQQMDVQECSSWDWSGAWGSKRGKEGERQIV